MFNQIKIFVLSALTFRRVFFGWDGMYWMRETIVNVNRNTSLLLEVLKIQQNLANMLKIGFYC